MIRWILLAVAVVGLSIAIPVALALLPADSTGGSVLRPVSARKGPSGKLYVEGKPDHDFGIMAQQSEGTHDFVLKNVGEGDLELTSGSSTCQCTVANFEIDRATGKAKESIVLKPGESTTITLSWKTKGDQGRFEKAASVVTSDPEMPEFWFKITGEVQPAISMVPIYPEFDFGSVPNTDSLTARWALASADKPDFQILEVTSSRPDLVGASVRPLTDEEKADLRFKNGYHVTVELKPTTEIGAFYVELVVKTDHPKQPEVRGVAKGQRVGPISLVPGSIRIPDANSSDGGSRSLLISVRGQDRTRFEVADVPAGLHVEIAPVEETPQEGGKARHYRLTATVPPGTSPGTIQGDLVLKSDHPHASQVKVPVNVVIDLGKRN